MVTSPRSDADIVVTEYGAAELRAQTIPERIRRMIAIAHPDFRDDLKGVLFSDVQNNSPAAKAGLKGGDLLVEFDGKQILTLSDYAYALRTKKQGDIVAVVVKRNGQDVKTDVTLEARR